MLMAWVLIQESTSTAVGGSVSPRWVEDELQLSGNITWPAMAPV